MRVLFRSVSISGHVFWSTPLKKPFFVLSSLFLFTLESGAKIRVYQSVLKIYKRKFSVQVKFITYHSLNYFSEMNFHSLFWANCTTKTKKNVIFLSDMLKFMDRAWSWRFIILVHILVYCARDLFGQHQRFVVCCPWTKLFSWAYSISTYRIYKLVFLMHHKSWLMVMELINIKLMRGCVSFWYIPINEKDFYTVSETPMLRNYYSVRNFHVLLPHTVYLGFF